MSEPTLIEKADQRANELQSKLRFGCVGVLFCVAVFLIAVAPGWLSVWFDYRADQARIEALQPKPAASSEQPPVLPGAPEEKPLEAKVTPAELAWPVAHSIAAAIGVALMYWYFGVKTRKPLLDALETAEARAKNAHDSTVNQINTIWIPKVKEREAETNREREKVKDAEAEAKKWKEIAELTDSARLEVVAELENRPPLSENQRMVDVKAKFDQLAGIGLQFLNDIEIERRKYEAVKDVSDAHRMNQYLMGEPEWTKYYDHVLNHVRHCLNKNSTLRNSFPSARVHQFTPFSNFKEFAAEVGRVVAWLQDANNGMQAHYVNRRFDGTWPDFDDENSN